MRCVDVNVLVYAHRPEAPHHQAFAAWLEDARGADEPLAVSGTVLSGFLRVVTHSKVFREPTPLDRAIEFCEILRGGANVLELLPGPRHWDIFRRLCQDSDARGNLIPDAYLAALAIEHGATFYSADRGFARFEELDWRHPLATT